MSAHITLRRFAAILFCVQARAPFALLAGGALRDLTFHKPIKDLDIFLHEGTEHGPIIEALRETFGGAVSIGLADFSSCEALTDCVRSETVRVGPPGAEHIEVNLITLVGRPTVAEVLGRMDFGICQIGMTGLCDIHTTAAYVFDANNHTFTVTRNDNPEGLERTLRRWDRLRTKYADWRLVNPFA